MIQQTLFDAIDTTTCHGATITFDRVESINRKAAALDKHDADHADNLALARCAAVELALRHRDRITNADEVGKLLKDEHGIDSLGPAAGAIFRGKDWEFTGQRVTSARVSNHAREIKVWRYVG